MLRQFASVVALSSLIPLAMLTSGCTVTTAPAPAYATTTTSGDVYPDDEPPPANIETYPSVVYEGQPAYFYHDHWYRRDGSGHYVGYRRNAEPPELHNQRARYAQHAPPPREEERHDERDDRGDRR